MWFLQKEQIPSCKRNFSPAYFKDASVQKKFEDSGFVVLKNIVSDELIEEGKQVYKKLQKMEGYDVKDKFVSSGNFSSRETQQFVFSFVENYLKKIVPGFINLDNCVIGNGGALFIKPNANESILHPHQDSSVVDESKYYGIFIWIPLSDITLDNGPLYVLPKSHLWGNYYRSQHIPWAFRKENKFLWERMQPILVNKGDIICFDTSIIHGSGKNDSTDYRVTVCGVLLPHNHQKVEFLHKDNIIYKYYITDDYWLDGGKASTLEKFPYDIEKLSFPNPISKKSILDLIKRNTI